MGRETFLLLKVSSFLGDVMFLDDVLFLDDVMFLDEVSFQIPFS